MSAAVLIRAGRPVAQCVSAYPAGTVVAYGFARARGGNLVEVGRAKLSRARRYLDDRELMCSTLPDALTNLGGGPAS
jgi:hypothetical protein